MHDREVYLSQEVGRAVFVDAEVSPLLLGKAGRSEGGSGNLRLFTVQDRESVSVSVAILKEIGEQEKPSYVGCGIWMDLRYRTLADRKAEAAARLRANLYMVRVQNKKEEERTGLNAEPGEVKKEKRNG